MDKQITTSACCETDNVEQKSLPELSAVFERYRERARIIKALAHPSRIYILDQLAQGPRCVCELTDLIGADASTVSRHLSVMSNAGIIDFEKRGTQVWYRLVTPCLLHVMDCVENAILGNPACDYSPPASPAVKQLFG